MSYGLKYTLTFREETGTATAGALYKVNIYKSGFSGASTSVSASGNPLSLSYKKQDLISPVCGSELTIGLMSLTNFEYLEFATAAPLQYYVDVLLSTDNGTTWTTYWSGVNTTDCYTEPYKNAPYPINLKFNCGLGELQWHRYESGGNLVAGLENLILTISNCLSFLPYNKNVREIINIREDKMLDADGFLEQCYLSDMSFTEIADDGEVHGKNCNILLKDILTSLNCRIYQSNNMWYVERIWQRTQNAMTWFDYSLPGSFQLPGYAITHSATGSFDPRLNINNAAQPKLVTGGDWAVTQKKPSLSYQFDTKALDVSELITNPFFEDTPTTKTSQNEPAQWDFGASLNAYINADLVLKEVNPYTNDIKYRTGLCFDNNAINGFNAVVKSNYLTHGDAWGTGTNPLKISHFDPNKYYAIHSVRRAGDTYSNPWVYIDPVNGSLQMNIRLYFSYKISPTASANSIGDIDIQKIMNSVFGMGAPAMIRLIDAAGHTYQLYGYNLQSNANLQGSWTKDTDTMGAWGGYGNLSPASLNLTFPDPAMNGQSTPLNINQFLAVYNNNVGGSFYWNFLAEYTLSAPFDTALFGATPGNYAFDVYLWPPVLGSYNASDPYNGALQHTSVSLDTFGINTIDIQYKDSFQSASGYTVFYKSADNDQRWNEQKVSVLYGDTLTPGYPGSFRLSDASPTANWHTTDDASVSTLTVGTMYVAEGGCVLYNGLNYCNAQGFVCVAGHTTWSVVSGSPKVMVAGAVLSDVLFNNYESLIANYRVALTGKLINTGGIGFWQNINDGTYIYAQVGNRFDFKRAQLTINMEEVSADPAIITKGLSNSGTVGIRKLGNAGNGQLTHTIPFTRAATSLATVAVISVLSQLDYPTN